MEIKKTEIRIYRYKYFISNDIMSISMHHIKIEKKFCLGFSIDLFSEVLNLEINVRIKNNIIKYNGKRYK